MLGRVGEVIAGAQGQSAAGAGRRHRRGDPVPGMAGRQQLHACSASATTRSAARATTSSRCKDSGLGILRNDEMPVFTRGGQAVSMTPQIRAFFDEPKTLIVTKANVKSRVHRRVYLDYVGVKRFDARRQPDRRIPHRRPVHLDRLHALDPHASRICAARSTPCCAAPASIPDSHSGKALVNVLETYPRDELFQIDEDTLYEFALAILQLDERPRVRVLARRDRFDRFVSVLVYRAARALRQRGARADRRLSRRRLQRPCQRLLSVLSGRPAGARALHHRPRTAARRPIRTAPAWRPRSARIVRTWTDGLHRGAGGGLRAGRARGAARRATATPSRNGYREAYAPPEAVDDIRVIEALSPERPLGVDFYRARRGRQALHRPQGLEPRPADPAVGAGAGAGEHGLPRRRRAHLRDRAGERTSADLAARHGAGARRRRRGRSRRRSRARSKPRSSW